MNEATTVLFAIISVFCGIAYVVKTIMNLMDIYHPYGDIEETPVNIAHAVFWPVFFLIKLASGTVHAPFFAIKDAFHFRR